MRRKNFIKSVLVCAEMFLMNRQAPWPAARLLGRRASVAIGAAFVLFAAGCSTSGGRVDVAAEAPRDRVAVPADTTAASDRAAAESSTTTAASAPVGSASTTTTAARARSTTPTTAEPARPHGDATTTTTVAPVVTTVPTSGAPTTTTTQPPKPTMDALADCSKPETGIYRPSTEDDFVEAVAGAWLLCKAPSVFGTNEAGLYIDPDGGWSKLERLKDGSLAPMAGWDNNGWWEVVDTSMMNGPGSYQLNLKIASGGTVMVHPVFASNLVKMRLDNNGVHRADYVQAE